MIAGRTLWLRTLGALASLASLVAPTADGANIWLSLNLEFNTPGDFNSGGTWTVVAKADERGISALVVELTDINFDINSGFLAPAIFYSLADNDPDPDKLEYNAAGFDVYGVIHGGQTETTSGQANVDFNRRFYDVGVIGGATQPGENGTPAVAPGIASRQVPWGDYVDDPLLQIFGSNPDLGSFTGGVEIVTGTFNPGVVPEWRVGRGQTDGNVWPSTTSVAAIAADIHTTIRHVIPEPATLGLAGVGLAALVSLNRRQRG